MSIETILDDLVAATGASRATLRRRTDVAIDAGFPIAAEVLAPGVPSIRDVRAPNMANQPVVLRVLAGQQVVQDDCREAFPGDEPFHTMLGLYGGMRAQIVTPIFRDGSMVAILSLHELKAPRQWTAEEIARCSDAAARIDELLDGGST